MTALAAPKAMTGCRAAPATTVSPGGSGNDTFIFQIGDGSDTIMDLTAGDIVEITRYSTFQSIQTVDSDIIVTLSDTDQLVFPNTDYSTVVGALHFSPLTLYGTPAMETLTGTSGNDSIYGFGSLDTIYGLAGNDTLVGGETFDVLYGGSGNNFLYGEGGNDTLVVDTPGDNYLDGGTELPGYSSYGPTADLVRLTSETSISQSTSGSPDRRTPASASIPSSISSIWPGAQGTICSSAMAKTMNSMATPAAIR